MKNIIKNAFLKCKFLIFLISVFSLCAAAPRHVYGSNVFKLPGENSSPSHDSYNIYRVAPTPAAPRILAPSPTPVYEGAYNSKKKDAFGTGSLKKIKDVQKSKKKASNKTSKKSLDKKNKKADAKHIKSSKKHSHSEDIKISKIEFLKHFIKISKGEEMDVDLTILPKGALQKKLFFGSSDNKIASFHDGRLTAINKGFVMIYVSSRDDKTMAACSVKVV